ncbi:MAG: polysaccharide deacetylase [Actinomycetia bacterium]|nr:polysaccharide deacetylase [Actinomycetes bacterium]
MSSRAWALGVAGAGIGLGLGVAARHAVPSVTSVDFVRRTVTPSIAGIGDPDHTAITFDDGPDPASTPAFLEALDALGWRATFFMLGSMVDASPGLAAEVVAAGHEVGVHAYQHDSMLLRSGRAARADLARTRDRIADVTGVEPGWFRPPYGILSGGALRAARALELRTVLWTAWGRDWRPVATPETVVADLRKGRLAGGTVLLHDSDCTSSPGSWRSALGALPRLADELAAMGLRAGPVGDHGIAA